MRRRDWRKRKSIDTTKSSIRTFRVLIFTYTWFHIEETMYGKIFLLELIHTAALSRLRSKIGFASVSLVFKYGPSFENYDIYNWMYFQGPWPASMLREIQDVLDALGVTKTVKVPIVTTDPRKQSIRGKFLALDYGDNCPFNVYTDEGLLLMDFLESKGHRCLSVSDKKATEGHTMETQGLVLRMPTMPLPSAPCPPEQ